MARLNVNATRMELSNLKKRLEIAEHGYKLLKDKQDELMRQFIELVKVNKQLREKVENKLHGSFQNFFLASSLMSPELLEAAISLPKETVSLRVEEKNIMSVHVPVITLEENTNESNS